jgi:5'-nucleotidase
VRAPQRRVLVSNDDSIHASGLHAFAAALAAAGHDVMVVAPDKDMTASGPSTGGRDADRTVHYEQVELTGLAGIPAYVVAGPPALGVVTACRSGFGAPPDVVAVGVNAGLNTGGCVCTRGPLAPR